MKYTKVEFTGFARSLMTLDHHDLNERLNGIHPTSENLCKHFYDHLRDRFNVVKVRVSETDGTWAEYVNFKKPA
jgi:6-pyruvoyl-tetrahydropterin synthase